ncbi:hypothetical protein JX266_013095 [Neoarthrinium moseri]|nr:hypothetical protein JX266_013095 [Neoarthrinium moseri]
MTFLYSTVVDPTKYETEGLCDGIEVRQSNFTHQEDRGAIRAHQDWNKYVGPCRQYRGTLGPTFSFMSLTVPECLPDRLEVISYANEFAFLHDGKSIPVIRSHNQPSALTLEADITDSVEFEESEIENDEMQDAFLEAARMGSVDTATQEARRKGKRQIQSQLFEEMLSIDPECAKTTMKSWAQFIQVGSSRQHETRFNTLTEYFPYRIMDVGEMFWYGVVTFGLGLRIPDHELDLCRSLMAPAWTAVQVHEAMQICRQLIKDYVSRYLQTMEEIKVNTSISSDLRKYLQAMLYSISGNVVWSLTCPRYNPDVEFNQTQLDWMFNGVPLNTSPSIRSSPMHSDYSLASTISDPVMSTSSGTTPGLLSFESLIVTDSQRTAKGNQTEDAASLRFEMAVLEAPYVYISSLPSKGVRNRFIDALDYWLKLCPETVAHVKQVTDLLHNASLILDDFEDDSPLRRGKPATHTIFGAAQSINTSNYTITKAIRMVLGFVEPARALEILDKIMSLFQGQAMDLFWSYNNHCPSLDEYYRMVDNKTGQLFCIATYFMVTELPKDVRSAQMLLERFTLLLGRYFQVRDDYQNLMSADYTRQKGFCEDLDEGKYTVPLIFTLQSQPPNLRLLHILSIGKRTGKLAKEQKDLVLKIIEEAGGFQYTRSVLADLYGRLCGQLQELEVMFGSSNTELRCLLELLKI